MNQSQLLRIYLPENRRLSGRGFLKMIFAPLLSHHLLNLAQAWGIEQAIILKVSGGYIQHHRISFDGVEFAGLHHPVCVEMAGNITQLADFLYANQHILKGLSYYIIDDVRGDNTRMIGGIEEINSEPAEITSQ